MNSSEAVRIIRILADGVDPITGEVFEGDSPYQNPTVIRALFASVEALESHAKREQRVRTLPTNAGKPWSDDEDKELIESHEQGLPIGELSRRHQRTQGSIVARLVKHGLLDSAKPPYGNQP